MNHILHKSSEEIVLTDGTTIVGKNMVVLLPPHTAKPTDYELEVEREFTLYSEALTLYLTLLEHAWENVQSPQRIRLLEKALKRFGRRHNNFLST